MLRNLSVAEARACLRTRAQLEDDGGAGVRRAVRDGLLLRVQRNRYVDAETWVGLWPESRHRIEVVAAAEEMRGGPAVLCRTAAAVLHGLPLYRHRPKSVEMTVPGSTRMSSRPGATRHVEALAEEDVAVVDGIRCTSLERTVFDIARTLPWESAVACADAGLRRRSVRGRAWERAASDEWRDDMRERIARASGARGIRQARRVAEFADGRAESPGESVSRVQLARLGFTELDLQVPVPSPSGRDYEVDIGILSARTFWEFDGQDKYTDAAKRAGASVQEVVLQEKRREDWIRGKTQWRLVRGEHSDIATPEAMAARLAAFGIRPPR